MKKIILIIAFFFLITSKFTAQVKDISFTFSPGAEYTWWDNNAGFKDGTLVGGKLGFGFGEYLELRGVYLQSLDLKTDFSNFGLSNFDESLFTSQSVKLTRWGGEFKANIGTKRLKPYFTIGTGVQNIEIDSKDFEQIYGSLGVGFKVNLAKRAVLSVEAKNTTYNFNAASALLTDDNKISFNINDETTTKERLSNWGLMGSLQFYLGGRKPGTLTELDEAYLNKFKGGFRGMQVVLEPSVAHISFDDKSLFKDTYMVGGYLGFDFNEYIGLRGFYFNATNNNKISTDFDELSMYGIEFRARLNDGNGVTPYLILGGGYLNTNNLYVGKGDLGVDSGEFGTGGLGLNIPLGRRVLISGGLRAMFTSGEDIDNISAPNDIQTHLMYNAGIKFTIGGKSKAPSTVYNEKVSKELSVQQENNSEKINSLKTEYQAKITDLESEIEKAYEAKDVNKALELLEDKKEAQEALKEVEKISKLEIENNIAPQNGTIIQMTPVEFESLIDRILKGINQDSSSDATLLNVPKDSSTTNQLDLINARIDVLEQLILEKKEVKKDTLKAGTIADKKVENIKEANKEEVENDVPEISEEKKIETKKSTSIKDEKESVEEDKTSELKAENTALRKEEKKAKKEADKSEKNEKRLETLNKKAKENDESLELNEVKIDSSELKNINILNDSKNANVVDTVQIEHLKEQISKPYLNYKNSSIQAGYQFSNSGYAVLGARSYFSMGKSSFELMPEVFAGFADKTVFGVSANVLYPFLQENEKIQPYIGVGAGTLYNGDNFKGSYNAFLGSHLPFISENLFLDYTMRNSFELNQFSIGYKFLF